MPTSVILFSVSTFTFIFVEPFAFKVVLIEFLIFKFSKFGVFVTSSLVQLVTVVLTSTFKVFSFELIALT